MFLNCVLAGIYATIGLSIGCAVLTAIWYALINWTSFGDWVMRHYWKLIEKMTLKGE